MTSPKALLTAVIIFGSLSACNYNSDATRVGNILVEQKGEEWLSWWEPDVSTPGKPNLIDLKPAQEKAIASVSGCTVTGSKYIEATVLAATVAC